MADSKKRIRLGMVGGGKDAFIGEVHRIAARIDDCYELVAGALSSPPEKSLACFINSCNQRAATGFSLC